MKIFTYPSKTAETRVAAIAGRGLGLKKKDERAVAAILADVQKNGDRAVAAYSRRFDSPKISAKSLPVSEAEIRAASGRVDRAFSRALNRACRQIEQFHREQRRRSWINTDRPGTLLGQLIRPVDAAGVYVPGAQGGKTPLVSSVLMGGHTGPHRRGEDHRHGHAAAGRRHRGPAPAGGRQKGRRHPNLQDGQCLGHRRHGLRHRNRPSGRRHRRPRKRLG